MISSSLHWQQTTMSVVQLISTFSPLEWVFNFSETLLGYNTCRKRATTSSLNAELARFLLNALLWIISQISSFLASDLPMKLTFSSRSMVFIDSDY